MFVFCYPLVIDLHGKAGNHVDRISVLGAFLCLLADGNWYMIIHVHPICHLGLALSQHAGSEGILNLTFQLGAPFLLAGYVLSFVRYLLQPSQW